MRDMTNTVTEGIFVGERGSKACLLPQKKEFQTKHQLLAWRQYATIEHNWYRIHGMDLEHNTLLVERLTEETGYHANGRIVDIVRMSAMGD